MRGHVRKRGNKWCVVVYLGIGNDGKRKYKWHSGFDTKKAAEKAMASIVRDVSIGTYVDPSNDTVQQFFETWLAHKKQQVRDSSYRIYSTAVEKHINPHIGKLKLDALKPYHLTQLYHELSKSLSSRYINQIHSIIHDALDRALKWEMVPRNVAEMVDAPKPEKKKFPVWTLEETQRFLSHPESKHHRFYVAFVLALTTGMRESEILGLRWKNIDWESDVVHVVEQQVRTSDGFTWGPPKSESGVRDIVVPKEAIDALRTHKARQNEERLVMKDAWINNDLVIARVNGNWVSQSFLRFRYVTLVEAVGVPYIRFHDLRHTHASLLLQLGEETKVLQERLGHSSYSVTMDTYTHVLPKLRHDTAHRLSTGLFENTSKHED